MAIVLLFQSSPVPRDGCNRYIGYPERRIVHVSILTRPEGRVQLERFGVVTATRHVSILTRPEGRVQPRACCCAIARRLFQSSPVPRDGCNQTQLRLWRSCWVSILTRPEGRVQLIATFPLPLLIVSFNPHPSRGTGATNVARFCCRWWLGFQSSPVPRDGCNQGSMLWCSLNLSFNPHPSRGTGATPVASTHTGACQVSILTRPEGRVQPSAP